MKEEHFEVGPPLANLKHYTKDVEYFFKDIKQVVKVENHRHKFSGPNQLLDMLHDSAEICGVNVEFKHINGYWCLSKAKTAQDVNHLKHVVNAFRRLYRHHALDYKTDEDLMLE
jgi:hypothetical protein